MTLFFYVVSIAFHTRVPSLQNCQYTSRKQVFWLRVQPFMHRLLHLFIWPERLATHHLFAWSKKVKIAWGKVWRLWRMWKALEGQILDCCNSRTGSMGQALSCCNKTPVLRLPCLLVLIAGHRWFLRRSAYIALVTVFPLGMKCFKITPHSSQKRVSITFPTDGCVRNILVLVRGYGAILGSLYCFLAGGSGPRFHLQ